MTLYFLHIFLQHLASKGRGKREQISRKSLTNFILTCFMSLGSPPLKNFPGVNLKFAMHPPPLQKTANIWLNIFPKEIFLKKYVKNMKEYEEVGRHVKNMKE